MRAGCDDKLTPQATENWTNYVIRRFVYFHVTQGTLAAFGLLLLHFLLLITMLP